MGEKSKQLVERFTFIFSINENIKAGGRLYTVAQNRPFRRRVSPRGHSAVWVHLTRGVGMGVTARRVGSELGIWRMNIVRISY